MTARRILRLRSRVALVAALVAIFLGASSTAAWAVWTASGPAASSVVVGKVSASINGTSAMTTTFSSTVTSFTAPVTFANTGSIDGTYSTATTVVSGSSTALAAAVKVTAWRVASAGSCDTSTAIGSGSVSGTWASLPSMSGSLAAGASVVWCIRSTLTSSAPASATTNPNIALTVADGGWTSGAVNGGFYLNSPAAIPALTCTNYTGNWHVTIAWDASSRSLDTYYGLSVNGTRVGAPEQGHTAFSDLASSDVSTAVAADGATRVDVVVLDSNQKPTTTVVATGPVTFFASQGSRAVKCGG